MKIYLYTQEPGPRLKYVAGFIFEEVLNTEYEIITDHLGFAEKTININYSAKNIPNSLWIFPSGLLEEKGIQKQKEEILNTDTTPCLFPVKNGDLSFDIFSAVFYMLSRYEEYLPYKKDQYNRFTATSSLAFRNGFLDKPVVNQWVSLLTSSLIKKFPGLEIPKFQSGYIASVDIDNPWAYLHKPFVFFAGGIVKDLLFFRRENLLGRMQVLSGKKKDPYDSYDFLLKFHDKKLKMFLLIGNRDRHDNKIPINNSYWRELITRLDAKFTIGLHPSFLSNKNINILLDEKRKLEEIIGHEITISRQHFLKLQIPDTYRNLISMGIKEDHSMGFADQIGFRAGTSFPFFFYDLEKEEKTSLKIVPFTIMDRSLKDYMKLTPAEAKIKISKYIEVVKEYGGNFVSVWHNESLGDSREWNGWIEVYKHMQKEVESLQS